MDSPYEHVPDDGEPLQGSAGLTNDLGWLTKAGEEKTVPYDGDSNTRDMSHPLRGTNRTLDPVEHLPPELSTFVIAQALPPQDITSSPSIYPPRLIELTTVSKKWQRFLFSTPVLWSELVIDEKQEDLLATLSVFVRLSSDTPIKLILGAKSTGIDWPALASILSPAAERVTCLTFGIFSGDDLEWVSNALSNLLERLCRLPRLNEVNVDRIGGGVSLVQIKAFGLPSTVKFNGLLRVELPMSCRGSGTLGRFFDVVKCKSFRTSGQLLPLSQPNLLVEYSSYAHITNIISNGTTLLQLESLADPLVECNCFEQVVYMATFTLHRLQVIVDLSQTEDLLDCLQMLIHLQFLDLQIGWEDRKITRDHIFSGDARLDLRKFTLRLVAGVEDRVEAQRPLGDLFSALKTLYPGVEEVHLIGSAWIGLEASYLQSLRALKSLVLAFEGPPLSLPSGSINLPSAQCLEMRGMALFDRLSTPNLLSLVLQLGSDVLKLDDLFPFPRGLRSLALTLVDNMEGFSLTSLDCPDLRYLYLRSWQPRPSLGCPWLSNLVSIKIESHFRTFTDSSSNQMCITLLCYPRRLPSLRQLHFAVCVEWDVLFFMLERRNCEGSGVQRIDTITLPFIPFAFHQLLARLLVGETVELPSLTSLSLEATRELIFDASVPGCFACMKNMRPGCTARLVPDAQRNAIPVDILYPPEDPVFEEAPQEIRDWLSQRWESVEMWKASYKSFALNFAREGICAAFPHVSP